jgi:hypothetical protein
MNKPSDFELAMRAVRIVHRDGDMLSFIRYVRSLDVEKKQKGETKEE